MYNISELLKPFNCECGKRHTCDIKYVFVEENAVKRLPEVVKDFKKILVVADGNTFSQANGLDEALNGKDVVYQIFSKELLIPDEKAVEKIKSKCDGVEFIVGIGSGVIQDLCKYVSFNLKLKYAIIATAPSMDGYASSGAAMLMHGLKITYPTIPAYAIIADTNTICNAPYKMIQAGYGDIIGKYSSLNDWKLGHVIEGEYFCQKVYDLTYSVVKQVEELRFKIKERDKNAIKILMEGLIIMGIAISYVKVSRPASGSEHHLSHFFEVSGVLFDKPYLPHGTDVGFSTVFTAQLREKIVDTDFKKLTITKPDMDMYRKDMKEIFGECAEEYINLQEKTGRYKIDYIPKYIELEKEIKDVLKEMPSSKYIEQILNDVGLELNEFYSTYDDKRIHDSIIFAKDIKSIYTVLWLNYHLFYPF